MQISDNHSHFGARRLSRPRRAIAATVDAMKAAFTADDLVARVRETSPGTGTATVYRAIAAMEDAGALERVGSRNGSTLFVRCVESGHHHHLVCTGCGAVAHTPCPLAGSCDEPGGRAPEGFVVTSHELTMYGLCAECATATTPTRKG